MSSINTFAVAGATSEFLPSAHGEDYLRTTVILEDGQPELEGRVLNKFSMHIDKLCTERGLCCPTIVYADRSEIGE